MKNKLYVSTIIVVEYEENKTISEITNDLKKLLITGRVENGLKINDAKPDGFALKEEYLTNLKNNYNDDKNLE